MVAVTFLLFFVIINISVFGANGDDSNGFPFYSRMTWGAQKANDTRSLTKPVPYVVIHHTYIPGRCDTFDQCSKYMRIMQNAHSKLGWGDIGYNFCVGSDGAVYEGRGWKVVGVHAGPANNYSVGICLIGDWRKEVPPPQQLSTTQTLIASGVQQGVISPKYTLIGHNQTEKSESPGPALYKVISTWDHFSPAMFRDPNRYGSLAELMQLISTMAPVNAPMNSTLKK